MSKKNSPKRNLPKAGSLVVIIIICVILWFFTLLELIGAADNGLYIASLTTIASLLSTSMIVVGPVCFVSSGITAAVGKPKLSWALRLWPLIQLILGIALLQLASTTSGL